MRILRRLFIISAALVAISSAQAVVVFSDVLITGTLSAGSNFVTGPDDIDFFLPDAIVGDPVHPRRFGDLVITYRAQSDVAMSQMTVSLLGALSGSGIIFFNEVVEDVTTGAILATANATLDSFDDLPYTNTFSFSGPSEFIKVKKSFVFVALDTASLDLAALTLVEQKLGVVPEPATMSALGVGVAALIRRRRR